MVSSYTTNKNLEKPGNGDYVDTWNVPVNSDMDVIDAAFGGVTSLNATGGSAVLTDTQYQRMALNITGAISASVVYTIPSGVGGIWVVRNATTDASGGPWSVTIASGGGGSSVVCTRGKAVQVYSDGTNIRDVSENVSQLGTVTSVDVSGGTTGLTTSGGPITTSGTITIAGTLGIANGGTGITSFGTGVQTALGQNVTGSGGIVLSTSPTIATPTVTTSVTSPKVIGGTTASSTLALQSTSGVGTSDSITFNVGNNGATTAMTVNTSGNVGIGVSSPSYGLDVGGTTANKSSIRIQNTTAGSSFLLQADTSGLAYVQQQSNAPLIFATNNLERMRISAVGGLSVGTTADPGAGSIYATGNITAYYSDDRLKTRLGPIESPLEMVSSLSGFYYEANETAQALGYEKVREVGVSAQEVAAILPEIVAEAPIDPQYLTVRYERLVPLLIEAIKELKAKVETLEAK